MKSMSFSPKETGNYGMSTADDDFQYVKLFLANFK